jgi:hypothetical protein
MKSCYIMNRDFFFFLNMNLMPFLSNLLGEFELVVVVTVVEVVAV